MLVGKVTSEKRFSHEVYGEKFYNFDLSVPRLSGNADLIPITISERLLTNKDIEMDSKVTVIGQFRSYNSYDNDRNRLILTVFAKDITFAEDQENDVKVGKDIVSNEVVLNGYICKKPIYRKTPFGREIADLLHVSNNTIETHRKSLMSKLEARNAVDLVLKAINLGIIPLDSK